MMMDRLEGAHRYNDALLFVEQHPAIDLNDGEYEELYFNSLVESHKEREAFDYLCEQIGKGFLRDQHLQLLDLALSLDRVDDLLLVKHLFELYEIRGALLLVNAYEQMTKKDVKRGLELIEQAKGAGLSEDTALVFTARFLLMSGFPKRVVGLSEKMLKRNIPARYIYPLLIQAYRDLGKEAEAKKAEKAYAWVM